MAHTRKTENSAIFSQRFELSHHRTSLLSSVHALRYTNQQKNMALSHLFIIVLFFFLTSPASANGGSPCGSRCILDPKLGKWVCTKVVCPQCTICVNREKCRLRLLGFRCCGTVGRCYPCPGCDCKRVNKRMTTQMLSGGTECEDCSLPTVDASTCEGCTTPV